jgi:hypothetical protein
MILEVRILNELRAYFLKVRILKRIAGYREMEESAALRAAPKTFSGGRDLPARNR